MEEKILAALLDLRIALGELQASMTDVDKAIRKLMAVQIEALELKSGEVPSTAPGEEKGASTPESRQGSCPAIIS